VKLALWRRLWRKS